MDLKEVGYEMKSDGTDIVLLLLVGFHITCVDFWVHCQNSSEINEQKYRVQVTK
jgi:hypothetical protein